MESFLLFMLTLAVAVVGGMIALKLKFPAGAMVGAMVAVIALNLFTGKAFFYSECRIALQILAGAMIGGRMSKGELLAMKKLPGPMIVLFVGVIAFNIIFGTAMFLFTALDAPTSLFATAPGGMSDMAIISADLGANSAYVAMLQLSRLLIIFTIMPPVFKRIANSTISKNSVSDVVVYKEVHIEKILKKQNKYIRLLILFAVSATGGILFDIIGITAGGIIGAMIFSSVYCIITGPVEFPKFLKLGMQFFAGAFIGMRMDMESLLTIADLGVPLLIMLLGVVVYTFGTAFIMHKCTKLELTTCLLSSTPGGVQEMSLLSEELGADTPKIAILQTARLFLVVLLFPTLLSALVDIASNFGI